MDSVLLGILLVSIAFAVEKNYNVLKLGTIGLEDVLLHESRVLVPWGYVQAARRRFIYPENGTSKEKISGVRLYNHVGHNSLCYGGINVTEDRVDMVLTGRFHYGLRFTIQVYGRPDDDNILNCTFLQSKIDVANATSKNSRRSNARHSTYRGFSRKNFGGIEGRSDNPDDEAEDEEDEEEEEEEEEDSQFSS